MSTIRDTALACYGGRLPRGTGAKAQEAVDCLVVREQEMAADLIDAGVALGADADQVRDILIEVGMHVADPEAEGGETDDATLAGLHAKIDALSARVDDAIRKGTKALKRRGR